MERNHVVVCGKQATKYKIYILQQHATHNQANGHHQQELTNQQTNQPAS